MVDCSGGVPCLRLKVVGDPEETGDSGSLASLVVAVGLLSSAGQTHGLAAPGGTQDKETGEKVTGVGS